MTCTHTRSEQESDAENAESSKMEPERLKVRHCLLPDLPREKFMAKDLLLRMEAMSYSCSFHLKRSSASFARTHFPSLPWFENRKRKRKTLMAA